MALVPSDHVLFMSGGHGRPARNEDARLRWEGGRLAREAQQAIAVVLVHRARSVDVETVDIYEWKGLRVGGWDGRNHPQALRGTTGTISQQIHPLGRRGHAGAEHGLLLLAG